MHQLVHQRARWLHELLDFSTLDQLLGLEDMPDWNPGVWRRLAFLHGLLRCARFRTSATSNVSRTQFNLNVFLDAPQATATRPVRAATTPALRPAGAPEAARPARHVQRFGGMHRQQWLRRQQLHVHRAFGYDSVMLHFNVHAVRVLYPGLVWRCLRRQLLFRIFRQFLPVHRQCRRHPSRLPRLCGTGSDGGSVSRQHVQLHGHGHRRRWRRLHGVPLRRDGSTGLHRVHVSVAAAHSGGYECDLRRSGRDAERLHDVDVWHSTGQCIHVGCRWRYSDACVLHHHHERHVRLSGLSSAAVRR